MNGMVGEIESAGSSGHRERASGGREAEAEGEGEGEGEAGPRRSGAGIAARDRYKVVSGFVAMSGASSAGAGWVVGTIPAEQTWGVGVEEKKKKSMQWWSPRREKKGGRVEAIVEW